MNIQVPDALQQLLDQCSSDDSIDRFEAFEELWDRTLNQGTPSQYAPVIFSLLLDWIANQHPNWADILYGIYGCVLDLSRGPTRPPAENARRTEALRVILGRHTVFEAALERPCVLGNGVCETHYLACDLLRMASPHRIGWLAAAAIAIIRREPSTHADLWTILDGPLALNLLPIQDLYLCAEQEVLGSLRRSAFFHLSSRGDRRGIDGLRQMLESGPSFLFDPTDEEAAIIARNPGNVPTDLLRDLFRSARSLRAVYGLASAVLRSIAQDQRSDWDVVIERRTEGGLFIRHPHVEAFRGTPSQDAVDCRDDLLRKRDLLLLDTDLWDLFGLERP